MPNRDSGCNDCQMRELATQRTFRSRSSSLLWREKDLTERQHSHIVTCCPPEPFTENSGHFMWHQKLAIVNTVVLTPLLRPLHKFNEIQERVGALLGRLALAQSWWIAVQRFGLVCEISEPCLGLSTKTEERLLWICSLHDRPPTARLPDSLRVRPS